jgi:hypothetical protein
LVYYGNNGNLKKIKEMKLLIIITLKMIMPIIAKHVIKMKKRKKKEMIP